MDVGEKVREAGETLKKICPPGAGAPTRTPPFPFPLLPPPPPRTLTISPLVGERGREVGIGREAERDTIKGWKECERTSEESVVGGVHGKGLIAEGLEGVVMGHRRGREECREEQWTTIGG